MHEVGHEQGRYHAPCSTSGADANFPYAGGSIGVWGYDILSKQFFSPTRGKDMMGYCPNEWVSDYTYAALGDLYLTLAREAPGDPAVHYRRAVDAYARAWKLRRSL